MKVIIIEDELKTAKDLKNMLEAIDNNIQVEIILRSVSAAVDWLRNNPAPEVIFSDIQLGDGLSFEIFKAVQVETPVIFCTAFDEYAIRAFESNSIDYLLKPVEENMLQKGIEKYLRFKDHLLSSGQHATNLNKAIAKMETNYRQSLLVSYREKIIPVKIRDIQLFHASNGTVMLYTSDNKSYPVNYTIENLESMLDPLQFFRANRQFILNRDFIRDIEHYFNRKLLVTTSMDMTEKIIVSKIKAQPFLKWMEM